MASPGVLPVERDAASLQQNNEVEQEGGVTLRAVVLCLALAVAFGYINPIIDRQMSNTFLGNTQLPPGAVGVLLLLLIVVNPLLYLLSAARGKRRGLSRAEALTIYISSLFSVMVSGHGSENWFVSIMIAPFYYATRENGWLEFLEPNLRPWFSPALMSGKGYDEAGARVVSDWYSGGKAIPWDAWLIPLLAWGALLMAIYFMFCCLAVMLRAQWAEREALAFPLLRLPLTLTEDLDRPDRYGLWSRFVRNPLMWVGFFVAAFIQLLNGLNFYYPDIPLVPLNINTAALFVEAPWNQLGDTPIRVFPIMVGITYLLTSEISFSLWSFYWLFKMQYVLAYYFGFLPQAMPTCDRHSGRCQSVCWLPADGLHDRLCGNRAVDGARTFSSGRATRFWSCATRRRRKDGDDVLSTCVLGLSAVVCFHCGLEHGSRHSLGCGARVLDYLSSTRYCPNARCYRIGSAGCAAGLGNRRAQRATGRRRARCLADDF
jgi:hypothetical protein